MAPSIHGHLNVKKVGTGKNSKVVIHEDPHQIEWRDQSDQLNPDPEPHQSDKLDPDPRQFADEKLKCMEYEAIWAPFQGFEPC